MTLNDLIQTLQKVSIEFPEAGEQPVVVKLDEDTELDIRRIDDGVWGRLIIEVVIT